MSWVIAFLLLLTTGCRLEMHDQPKRETFKSSRFFQNGSSARPLLVGTIPRGDLRTNAIYFEGLHGTNLASDLPVKLTRELLERGHERYDIYCAECHGATGEGNGMIVLRGFPAPPSYLTERLRDAPIGHFYRVITYGYGVMFPYAARVAPEDRWAIAAYIRALQMSASFNLAQLPEQTRAQLERNVK